VLFSGLRGEWLYDICDEVELRQVEKSSCNQAGTFFVVCR